MISESQRFRPGASLRTVPGKAFFQACYFLLKLRHRQRVASLKLRHRLRMASLQVGDYLSRSGDFGSKTAIYFALTLLSLGLVSSAISEGVLRAQVTGLSEKVSRLEQHYHKSDASGDGLPRFPVVEMNLHESSVSETLQHRNTPSP